MPIGRRGGNPAAVQRSMSRTGQTVGQRAQAQVQAAQAQLADAQSAVAAAAPAGGAGMFGSGLETATSVDIVKPIVGAVVGYGAARYMGYNPLMGAAVGGLGGFWLGMAETEPV